MGNRAMITNEKREIAIYLQWNGGRNSVEAFLEYAKIKQIRGGSYGLARLCQIIANFFDGTLSIGLNLYDPTFCEDNGIYVIDDDFNIVTRENFTGFEQCEYNRNEFLAYLDSKQPTPLGADFFNAQEITDFTKLKIGDKVAFLENGEVQTFEIIDFGADIVVNGTFVGGFPRIKRFGTNPQNINNYITPERKARLIKIA